MNTLFFVIAAMAVAMIIAGIFIKVATGQTRLEGMKEAPPYFRRSTLLNEKEQVLFHRLIEALPDHYIMAQVRLADIVGVDKCKNYMAWFNKISRKSVDFVVCEKSFEVVACIELDGSTHDQEERQKADGDKEEVLNAAGIPLVRISVSELPSSKEIEALLENALAHHRRRYLSINEAELK